jgi:hypothetical protein
MSVQAISWVLDHSESRLGPRHVLISIANHAKSDGTGAWPSVSTIAREAHLSIRQVQYCLVSLAKLGELRVSSGGPHGCNLYSLPKMLVQGLRTGTTYRGAVSGSPGTQNRAENVSKIAPEPKSIEPSIKTKKKSLLDSFEEDEYGFLHCKACKRGVANSRASLKAHTYVCSGK